MASKRGGEKLFYHNDHQGGVNVSTNIFAVVVQLNEYDPWGKVSRSEGSAEPTKRFNGKELDAESGLYYYGGRYHDPDLARFVSADPFIQEPGNPQNFNRYSYTINNPQKYIDPSGHFFGFIFSLIFGGDDKASKLFAFTDPFSFLLSKIPKKVNAGANIFGGVLMLLTGNPAGDLYIASGGLSFGKGNGFQIASQVLGFAAAASGQSAGDTSGGLFSLAAVGACKPGDDYYGARPQVYTFPIPTGVGSALGEFFIKEKSAGGFRGDNRNFDPAPNPDRSRSFFKLDFEKGIGTFQVNPTCTAGGIETCRSALPFGQGNILNVTTSGTTVTLSGEVRNSFLSFVPSALDVDVSFNVSITNTPTGISTIKGTIDPFPSFEFTSTVGGAVHVGPRVYESHFICLTGVCGSRTLP